MPRTREQLEQLVSRRDAENRQLRVNIEKLESTIAALTRANAQLANNLAKLTHEVQALRAQLARSEGRAPEIPSSQVPPFLKPPRAKTGKLPGRRRGHAGTARPRPVPDEEEDHTLKACPGCDEPVRPVVDAGFEPVVRFRYVEDIIPGKPVTTQHNCHVYWCRSCNKRVEPVVTAALPGARLGLRVMVWSAVQHFVFGIPAAKIVTLLREDYGFVVTAGGLQYAWHQIAFYLLSDYLAIIEKIRGSGVLHADETGWRINGITAWLWCFATKSEVGYFIEPSRSSSVATFVLGEDFGGTLITDFYSAYDACNAAGVQYCLAHLLRAFEKVHIEHGGTPPPSFQSFRRRVTKIIKEAIKYNREEGRYPPAREAARVRFERRLLAILQEPTEDADVRRLTKRMLRAAAGIFTFLTSEGVEPTNNHAEREIRTAVVMRKISGGSRSSAGADTRAVLMSIFRTQKLQGLDPVQTTIDRIKLRLIEDRRGK